MIIKQDNLGIDCDKENSWKIYFTCERMAIGKLGFWNMPKF